MLPTKVHRFHGYCPFTRGARAENWCIWLSCQELDLYLIFNAFSLMQYKLPSLGHICLIMKPYAIQTKILLYTFWCQNLTGACHLIHSIQCLCSIFPQHFFSFKCFQKYDLLCRLLKLFNFFLPFLQWILRDINFNKWNNDPCYTLNSESWDNLS